MVYIGKVLNNVDNLKQERLFVRVLGIHDIGDNFSDKNYGIWADNGIAIKNFSGYIPSINDYVYIMFVNGIDDPMNAIYLGVVRHQI